MLKAVTFLENQFGITIEPHEAVVENLNTLSEHHAACDIEKSLIGRVLKTVSYPAVSINIREERGMRRKFL